MTRVKKYSFEDYVEKTNAAGSVEALFKVFIETVKQHGLDRAIFSLSTEHGDIDTPAQLGLIHNYPRDWMSYYFEKGLEKIDPVMIYSLSQLTSYTWDEIPKNMKLNHQQQGCLDMGREAGLHNGICTPLRGPNHAIAGLSLASSEEVDSFDGNTDMITAYSNHFYIAYRRLGARQQGTALTEAKNYALTNRERDILTFLSQGKSYPDIATILNISSNTVGFHMRNIFRKLEVNDQILAVIRAIFYGLIHP